MLALQNFRGCVILIQSVCPYAKPFPSRLLFQNSCLYFFELNLFSRSVAEIWTQFCWHNHSVSDNKPGNLQVFICPLYLLKAIYIPIYDNNLLTWCSIWRKILQQRHRQNGWHYNRKMMHMFKPFIMITVLFGEWSLWEKSDFGCFC